ncbi:MAG TPA: lipocalin family protein [Desulfopila sp.]|nr:lipocalin family protein [Desulfopila sp.]
MSTFSGWKKLPAFVAMMAATVLSGGCLGYPHSIEPVDNFELNRYLGTWYEIARLDHRFERGLQQVTAEYDLCQDGSIRVVNRGYDIREKKWRQAEGRASFVEGEALGYLKVSFFGPFYASYVIFKLDDYEHAWVTGSNVSYLWYLARTPTVSPAILHTFEKEVSRLGFNTEELIYVKQ